MRRSRRMVALLILPFLVVSGAILSQETATGKQDGEHHDEEAESSSVGPEKGILEFHEDEGFKLAPEAMKSFGISVADPKPLKGSFALRPSSLLEAQGGKFVYRARAGFFKRIPVDIDKKGSDVLVVRSPELGAGDKVVVSGVPFLRTAELDATGGTPHGH